MSARRRHFGTRAYILCLVYALAALALAVGLACRVPDRLVPTHPGERLDHYGLPCRPCSCDDHDRGTRR